MKGHPDHMHPAWGQPEIQQVVRKLLFDEELVSCERILDEVNGRYGKWRMLAAHYIFEDGFWARKEGKASWLDNLVRP